MDQELQVPEGYCPNCEYPINPGTCPECGAIVAPEALSKSPASARRRKIRRRMFVFVPLLFLAILAFIVYRAVNWIALAPTGVLLSFQESYRDPVGQELFVRLRAGSLSQAQTQELLDHYVDDPFIEGFSKYPADVPFKVLIQCRVKLPSSGWIPEVEDWQLAVDGEQVDSSDMRVLQNHEGWPIADHWIWCPPLSEGRRRITIDGVATLKVRTPSGASAVLHRRRVHLSRDVEITGQLADYVQATGSAEMAGYVKQVIWAAAVRDPIYGDKTVLVLLAGKLKVPIAGMVLVRIPGQKRFTALQEELLGRTGPHFIYLESTKELERAEWLDVRINPDPLIAFHYGVHQYFDAAIEWRRLPIRGDIHMTLAGLSVPGATAPTSIVLSGSSAEE